MNIFQSLLIILSIITLSKSSYILYESYNFLGICPNQLPEPTCNNDSSYLGSSIYPLSKCVPFNQNNVIFTTEQDKIIQTTYANQTCDGEPYETIEYTIGSCNSTCLFNGGATFKLSIVDELEIPSNTYLSIKYGGECNENYKNDFTEIDIVYLSRCANFGYQNRLSSMVTCNKTFSVVTSYLSNDCTGSIYDISTYSVWNVCPPNGQNFLQICNQ